VALALALPGGVAWAAPRGGADPGAGSAPVDPWEPLNRKGYAVQGGLDRHLIKPLSQVYTTLTPGPIGRSIHNVLITLTEPAALVNDVLQLRLRHAGALAGRLLVNATFGVCGLFDVASRVGLRHHDNEFGVTLGRYGIRPGPYLYVPLLGPSTARDLVGAGVDFLINPIHWARYQHQSALLETRFALNGLDTRVATEPQLDALLSGAVDPYATLRSAYLQSKQGEVEGMGVPAGLPAFDEPAPEPAPGPQP
jgi:phospholipid-binding lipoprotein MlaA